MTTTKAQTNGEPKVTEANVNPLLTNQTPVLQQDWEAEARRLDGELRFWKTKYLEQMSHSAQVIVSLSQSFLTQEALARIANQGAQS